MSYPSQDEREFRIIYESFYSQAFYTAWAILKDYNLAEDATQEAFIEVFTHFDKLPGEDNLLRWLKTVTARKAIDLWRKHRKSQVREQAAVGPSSQDAGFLAAENKVLVYYLLQQLPATYRQIIYLRFYCDFSVRETAEIMQVKEGTVKSRLHRALSYLKGKCEMAREVQELRRC
ncbi:MAG: Putative DNA-directed RNA polymerase [Moorella sp. 60_41]|nr:MAG: Putative DNA-directed RNA polymerase [Moorella sp. 60_41]